MSGPIEPKSLVFAFTHSWKYGQKSGKSGQFCFKNHTALRCFKVNFKRSVASFKDYK